MMTTPQPLHSANGRKPASSAISPVGIAVALGRNRGLILVTALVASLAGFGYSFLHTRMYSTTALLFFAQGVTDARSQLAAQFAGGGAGAGGGNSKLVTTILRSRSLAEEVGRRVGRPDGTQMEPNPDGSIRVTVMHRDPKMAARIANAYPVVLNELVSRNGMESNRQKEALLERQIAEARVRLERSEDQMVRFQTGRNAADVEQQSAATISAVVALQQRIAEKEVAVMTLRRTATPNNPQLRIANGELAVLREQLQRLSSGGGGSRVLVPLREGPALKMGAGRLLREYTRNEQIYVALNAALAQAQIDLNGSLPVVTVVDSATVPGAPDGAGRLTLAAVAGILGLVAGVLLAIIVEVVRRLRQDPEHDPFLAVRRELRADRMAGVPSRS